MSSMHTPHTAVQPFALVRKGFDREQVTASLTRLEAEADLLRADRDSAVGRAERTAGELERERDRVRALEARVAELGRVPTTSEQMSDRLATMLGLATAEAESVRDAAHATADRIITEAEEQAWRLREAAATELESIRTRNAAVRTEHESVLDAARSRGEEIIRSAQRRAQRLDIESATRREQIDEDHRLASDLRRQETLHEEQVRTAASEAEITRLRTEAARDAAAKIADARHQADGMIDSATAYTQQLRDLRRTVLADLASVRARLEPIPAGVDHEDPLPTRPDLNSSAG